MKKTLCFLLLAIALQSCKKDSEPQLPPITTTGENILGCLVNGKVFEANKPLDFLAPSTFAEYNDTLVSIRANSDVGSIAIYFIGEIGLNRTLTLDKTLFQRARYTHDDIDYLTSNGNIGELILINIDTINYFISGTFWFDAVNEVGEKVEIREGRFDIKY